MAALAVTAIAWGYLGSFATHMHTHMAAAGSMAPGSMAPRSMAPGSMTPGSPGSMASGSMPLGMLAPAFAPWTLGRVFTLFTMWAVMMVAMMTPSVVPMVLLYAMVAEPLTTSGRTLGPTALFAAGYLAAWIAFSAVAALAQCSLEALALLTPMMTASSRELGAAVLFLAGAYQWSPAKDACLGSCRSPLAFIQRHGGFRSSAAASLRLGFLHGGYCIGCCWALMAVLFVTGVMSLLWIAVLMLTVLLEKSMPRGRGFARVTGSIALAAGGWMLFAGV